MGAAALLAGGVEVLDLDSVDGLAVSVGEVLAVVEGLAAEGAVDVGWLQLERINSRQVKKAARRQGIAGTLRAILRSRECHNGRAT